MVEGVLPGIGADEQAGGDVTMVVDWAQPDVLKLVTRRRSFIVGAAVAGNFCNASNSTRRSLFPLQLPHRQVDFGKSIVSQYTSHME